LEGAPTKRQLLQSIVELYAISFGSLTIHAHGGKVTHTETRTTDKELDVALRGAA
jgi:hypothetical protein